MNNSNLRNLVEQRLYEHNRRLSYDFVNNLSDEELLDLLIEYEQDSYQ